MREFLIMIEPVLPLHEYADLTPSMYMATESPPTELLLTLLLLGMRVLLTLLLLSLLPSLFILLLVLL
jgi:hypothetical protein